MCSTNQTGTSGQQPGTEQDQIPDPPSAAAAVGLMGFGALGAVAVAAVGVYGVLQMALMVAQGTGRSIMADKQTAAEQLDAAADRIKPNP
ncbi:g11668 [Coccomyxa elongata]